jgi:ferredoxin
LGKESKDMTLEEKEGLQLFINPDECIKCGACIPECPVDAIYRDEKEAILSNDEISIHRNYEFYGQKFS